MKNFFYNIYDFFLNTCEKLLILAIILGLSLLVLTRVNKLFKINVLNIEDKLHLSQEVNTEKSKKAPIIYMGELPEESLASSEEAEEIIADNTTNTKNDLLIVAFDIKEGDSIDDVMDTLKSVGLIKDPQTMKNLIENMNLEENISPGTYRVPENIKNLDLIETITIAVNQ